ncbi:MAG: hypothetical protein C0392_15660 [Syntrophus sp. (in: bacteria)]|nr:hypothetical protein [Syntrophus sp. (in: bacteria)]
MIQIESILVVTDLSAYSRHAVQRAARLAEALSIEKGVVLHVLEQSWIDSVKHFMGASMGVEKGAVDEAMRSLQALTDEIRQKTNFALVPQVRTGKILDVINKASTDFDLLVCGAHGEYQIASLALGTTSQRLASTTLKPVLVVKNNSERPYRRVLIAVDFSPNSVKALRFSRAIAPKAETRIVHVFEHLFEKKMAYAGLSDEIIEEYRAKARSEAEAEMAQIIESAEISSDMFDIFLKHGHPAARLHEIIDEWDPDLVIAGKHGRSRLEEFLLGSVTMHLLTESKNDVLVVT